MSAHGDLDEAAGLLAVARGDGAVGEAGTLLREHGFVVIAATGGRRYENRTVIERAFVDVAAAYLGYPIVLAVGDAHGADQVARDVAHSLGWRVVVFEANWRTHGRKAGPMRNRRLLQKAVPRLLLAFPGGRGTANMVKQAMALGIPVVTVSECEPEQAKAVCPEEKP